MECAILFLAAPSTRLREEDRMSIAADLERKYHDAARHLSDAQVAHIESGAFCDSPSMNYAQQCYQALRAHTDPAQRELFSRDDDVFHHAV